ncbi:hypothetical protein KAR10_06125, partial [bacterium]|nr:hypothetical protein [bacterium]
QAKAEQAKANSVKKEQVKVPKAKTDTVKRKGIRIPAPIDERKVKNEKSLNPISKDISEKFIPVREKWFAECVNKIRIYNKKQKNDGDQIIIKNQRLGGEAEIVLKVLQIKVSNDYLGQYKYLEDNAGVGFKDKLETCVFVEQSAECLTYFKKIQTDKEENSNIEESEAAQLLDMARTVAAYITALPESKAAADLVAKNIPEFIDLTHIESAKALGDKKTVAKLSSKIENLKRR